MAVRRLIGVYDADGSLRGELSYWVGARVGRAHCALCDLTHALVRERGDWKACRASLPVPFALYHRDDQPADVRAAADRDAPYVLADTGSGLVVLLDRAALDACQGDLDRFTATLDAALDEQALAWPDGTG
jgi:hypothetical protein